MRGGRRGQEARASSTNKNSRSESHWKRIVEKWKMTKTAGELATAIGAKVQGDASVELNGIAAPERAGLHDLIYVEAAKHIFFFQAEDGIRDYKVTGVQTCALPI